MDCWLLPHILRGRRGPLTLFLGTRRSLCTFGGYLLFARNLGLVVH